MINNEDLKLISKKLASRYPKDVCIQYLNRSIQHSKDWVGVTAGFSVLNDHVQKVYNFALV